MKPSLIATTLATILIFGCGPPESESNQSGLPDTDAPPAPLPVPSTNSRLEDGCARDAEGQVACLNLAFNLERCSDAAVLGSMFQANEPDGTFTYRTAYGIGPACLAELEESVAHRGFRESDERKFVAEPCPGYRESVVFGLQISKDGNVVEWERIKE